MFPPIPSVSRSALCWLALCLVNGIVLHAAEPRTWSDPSGKFRIQARFVSNENGKVTLKKSDGTDLEIELKKLSATDQKYIADLEKSAASPSKTKEADPFKSKPTEASKPTIKPKDGGTTKSKESRMPKEASTPASVPENPEPAIPGEKSASPASTGPREVTVTTPQMPWKFEPASAQFTLKPKSISLSKHSTYSERARNMIGSPSGKFAAIEYRTSLSANKTSTTTVVICDLEAGKQIAKGEMSGDYQLLGIHNDGKRVLLLSEAFAKNEELELWNVSTDATSLEIKWTPYATSTDRQVDWGAFVGDDRIVTVNSRGKLVVWNLDDRKHLYAKSIDWGGRPAISPDQKWLAYTVDKYLAILNLEEGILATRQPLPVGQINAPTFAFSPNQKRLSLFTFNRMYIWDFTSGEFLRETPHQLLVWGMTWPTDNHVLVAKQNLIDVDSQVSLWEYQGADLSLQIGGVTWFILANSNTLVGARLPTATVGDALAKAMTQPDFFVLQRGTTVKLDVSGVDPAGQQAAEQALTARAKEEGFAVGPTGTIELVAQTEIGKERTLDVNGTPFAPKQSFTVRDRYSRVKFIYQGQTVWQNQVGTYWPSVIFLEPNETLEQYVRKSEKFNFGWFGQVDLPKVLQKPMQAKPQENGVIVIQSLGKSRLTAADAQ